nr:MAG: maturation protein [Leviviridae sp.]
MPVQSTSQSQTANGWSQKTYHAVVFRDGGWRCALVNTVDPKIYTGPHVVWSRAKSRSWVHSSPWPVPVGMLKPVNPYTVSIDETSSPLVTWYTEKKEVGATCYERMDYLGPSSTVTDGGCNAGIPAIDVARKNHVNSRAMLNFLLKVKDQKSQLLVTLAEGRKTVNMIAGAARSIAGLRKRWLNRQPRRIRQNERQLHSSWLEYRYGWMPLYYDAYGIAKHLSSLNDTQVTFPVKGSATWESDSSEQAYWNAFYWKGNVSTRTTHRYKAKVGGFITIESRVARESVRAGLTNPLELAWELLPYSFVVDWFVKVGDYVEGMTALSGVSAHHCFASCQTDRAQTKSAGKTTYPTNLTITGPCQSTVRRIEYERWAVNPSLMQVDLSSLVDFDLQKQSWKHWVDGAALLKAAFRER